MEERYVPTLSNALVPAPPARDARAQRPRESVNEVQIPTLRAKERQPREGCPATVEDERGSAAGQIPDRCCRGGAGRSVPGNQEEIERRRHEERHQRP